MVDYSVSCADFTMGRKVLHNSLVFGVGVETRNSNRLFFLASRPDNACPNPLFQLEAFISVEKPLDVDTGMEGYIHNPFAFWAARYTKKMGAINPKSSKEMVKLNLRQVKSNAVVTSVNSDL